MSNTHEFSQDSPEAKELEREISEATQEFDKRLKEAAMRAGIRIKTEIAISIETNG